MVSFLSCIVCDTSSVSKYQTQLIRQTLSKGINSSSSLSLYIQICLSCSRYQKLTMSSIEMASASASRLRYQMLRPESESDDERERVILRPKKWNRFKGIPVRKRFRLKFSMSWKRQLKKKVRFVCAKVMKRFKEGHVHFGDLFAGNYLFTQVNPTSLEYLEKKLSLS